MKTNGIQKAIEQTGSQTELARRLCVSPQRVQFWTRHRIPAEWVLRVEKASGVPRHELRPDIYPADLYG